VIQIHLPGRVAEITDPLIALILAMRSVSGVPARGLDCLCATAASAGA
jgi:hypothetical protein